MGSGGHVVVIAGVRTEPNGAVFIHDPLPVNRAVSTGDLQAYLGKCLIGPAKYQFCITPDAENRMGSFGDWRSAKKER